MVLIINYKKMPETYVPTGEDYQKIKKVITPEQESLSRHRLVASTALEKLGIKEGHIYSTKLEGGKITKYTGVLNGVSFEIYMIGGLPCHEDTMSPSINGMPMDLGDALKLYNKFIYNNPDGVISFEDEKRDIKKAVSFLRKNDGDYYNIAIKNLFNLK
jgi:hypothetical protein